MGESASERKLVENEVIFRQTNENVLSGLKEVAKLAEDADQKDLAPDLNQPVQFYCECSNENCRERVKLSPHDYEALHQNKSQFILLSGHNLPQIERTMRAEDNFIVVEKFMTPPDKAETLHPTS